MELIIKEAENFEGEEREIIIEQIANHMKKSYLAWNKDAVEDEKIFGDLEELSGGRLVPRKDLQLADSKALIGKKKKVTTNKKKK